MSKIIAITGGIGSGKSTLTDFCEQLGYPVIDSDQLARQAVAPHSEGLQQIIEHFGEELRLSNGELDRAKLRQQIFNNPQAKNWLEELLHPIIRELTLEQIRYYRNQQYHCIFVAIPLLIEGIDKTGAKPDFIDEIWVVDCPESLQLERASQRDHYSKMEIKKILDQQVDRQHRLAFADQVLDNSANPTMLKQQLITLLAEYC